MERIYLDTNQLYFIRRIAEEGAGSDYGDYEWAYRVFSGNPAMVDDVRALCFIVALQYEWELDFLPNNASFAELRLSCSKRARATREAWLIFVEGLEDRRGLQKVPFDRKCRGTGLLSLDFIGDAADRVIIHDAITEAADVLMTSDNDILVHKARLAELNLSVMRPKEWLEEFLAHLRGDEDAVDWLEKTLFGIPTGV